MLGDDIAWALPEFRRQAESLMLDLCTITRAGEGRGEWLGDGQYAKPEPTTIYTGKCRLQITSDSPSSTNAGERDTITQTLVVQLPVLESGDVTVNDVVELTSCVNDPSLEGRKFTIAGRHGKSQATARRLRVTEVAG